MTVPKTDLRGRQQHVSGRENAMHAVRHEHAAQTTEQTARPGNALILRSPGHLLIAVGRQHAALTRKR
ncbi:hypothetical protein [Kribbella jiaozuonensis]|uniref:Uncharacterized protein n=1 Tax=Kribbella jiaozuonensis TaxID=2575441 RepID=A0A4V5UXC6_9ACTN|nr:hypothetical protein [Kribbella jiaozuonensis]TKK80133.1 hypothetical protein FDA38_17515 [Kribbella jiaozuonensis]